MKDPFVVLQDNEGTEFVINVNHIVAITEDKYTCYVRVDEPSYKYNSLNGHETKINTFVVKGDLVQVLAKIRKPFE